MIILLSIPPVGIILVLYLVLRNSGLKFSELPGQFYIVLLVVVPISFLMIYLVKLIIRRQISVELEISSDGIRHLTPGKERSIAWGDIQKAMIIKRGNRSAVLRLKLAKGSYNFDPFLVPDQPDAPQIKFKLGGPQWILSDGTIIRMSAENSAGYRALLENRPDLL